MGDMLDVGGVIWTEIMALIDLLLNTHQYITGRQRQKPAVWIVLD